MVDVRQAIDRDTLTQIVESSNKLGDYLFRAIDSELAYPIRIRASNPSSLIVLVESIFVTNPDHSRRRTIPPINGMIPNFSGGTVTIPAASGGNIVASPGGSQVLTLASGYNVNIGVNIDGSGNIVPSIGTSINSTPNLYAPPVPQGSRPAGYFNVSNVGGTIQVVANAAIVQYPYSSVSVTEGATFVKWGSTVSSTPYTVAADDYIIPIDTTSLGSPLIINLPAVTSVLKGRQIIIKDIGGNVSKTNKYANVVPNGSNTIEGLVGALGTTRMDMDYSSLTFTCDGSNGWWIW